MEGLLQPVPFDLGVVHEIATNQHDVSTVDDADDEATQDAEENDIKQLWCKDGVQPSCSQTAPSDLVVVHMIKRNYFTGILEELWLTQDDVKRLKDADDVSTQDDVATQDDADDVSTQDDVATQDDADDVSTQDDVATQDDADDISTQNDTSRHWRNPDGGRHHTIETGKRTFPHYTRPTPSDARGVKGG
jgi:hypothetical protein